MGDLHGEKFSHMPPNHTILRLDEPKHSNNTLFLLIFYSLHKIFINTYSDLKLIALAVASD